MSVSRSGRPGTMRLSENGERVWLRRSEMSSGLTSEVMEAGAGIEGGPGEFFLTFLIKIDKLKSSNSSV
jgi:hypothetical protein